MSNGSLVIRGNGPIAKDFSTNNANSNNSRVSYKNGDTTITKLYDSENQLTSSILDFDSNGSPDFTVGYYYDESGRKVKEIEQGNIDGVKSMSVVTYEYDKNGNIIKMIRDDGGNENIDSITEYKYDCWKNRLIQETIFGQDGEVQYVGNYGKKSIFQKILDFFQ